MRSNEAIQKAYHLLGVSQMLIEPLLYASPSEDASDEIKKAVFCCLDAVDLLGTVVSSTRSAPAPASEIA